MLKQEVTYEDFNGDTVTETFYFNLSKTEIVNMQLDYDGGMDVFLNRIVKAENIKALITEFKKLLLMSYGEKSEDGKRFIKNDELREAFSQTAAFDTLFMKFALDSNAAAEFVMGILPRDMVQSISDLPTPSPVGSAAVALPDVSQVSWTSPAETIPQPPPDPNKE